MDDGNVGAAPASRYGDVDDSAWKSRQSSSPGGLEASHAARGFLQQESSQIAGRASHPEAVRQRLLTFRHPTFRPGNLQAFK